MVLQLEERIKNSAVKALNEKPYGLSLKYRGVGQELLSYFKSSFKSFNAQNYMINAGNYRPEINGYDKQDTQEGYKTAEQPGYNAKRKDVLSRKASSRDESNTRYNPDMNSYLNQSSFSNKLYRISAGLERKFEIPSRYFVFDKPKSTEILGQGYKNSTLEYNFYLMYKSGSSDRLTPAQRDQAIRLESKLDNQFDVTQTRDMYTPGKEKGKKNGLFLDDSQIALKKESNPTGYALLLQNDPQTYRLFVQDANSKPFEDISKRVDALIDEINSKVEIKRLINSIPAGGFPPGSVDGLAKLAMSYTSKASYSGSKGSGSSGSSSSSSSGGSSGSSGGGK